jgi:hypothetical protein
VCEDGASEAQREFVGGRWGGCGHM